MSNKYVDEILDIALVYYEYPDYKIQDRDKLYKEEIRQQVLQAQLDGELTALENLKTDLGAYPDHPKYWHIRNIDDRIEQINKLKAELGEKDD